MSFTYNVATDLGKVRFLIPDTVDSGHTFEDEELQAILGLSDNVYLAAADAIDSKIGLLAGKVGSLTVLDVEIDTSKALAVLQKRVLELRKRGAEDDGYFETAEMIGGIWDDAEFRTNLLERETV